MIQTTIRRILKHQAIIIVVAVVALFTNLGATRLWDQDEGFFAGAAAEMFARGDWVVPVFNGELFTHKPPWMFWMMMSGFALFGETEFAARFFSALFGVATALLTYHLGRRMFSAEVGLWAGLIMASTLMFNVVARAATPDCYLVFFCTLSLYLYVSAAKRVRQSGEDATAADNRVMLPAPWSRFAAIYAVMGLAVLVKGPIGVLLPMGTIGLYLLCRTPRKDSVAAQSRLRRVGHFLARVGPRNFLDCLWQMRPLTAICAVVAVAGPWFLLVAFRTDGAFLVEFFGVHHFGRFSGAMDGHAGSILYYLPAVLIGFFPWSIFAAPVIVHVVRAIRRREQNGDALVFLVCWIVVFVGFFSLAATKLPNYILPAFPALALITASFLVRWIEQPKAVHLAWTRLVYGVLAAVGIGAILVPIVLGSIRIGGQSFLEAVDAAPSIEHDLWLITLVGLLPLAGGLACLFFAERRQPRLSIATMAATSVVLITVILAGVAVKVDEHQVTQSLAESIRRLDPEGRAEVGQHRYFRPSLVYYTRGRVQSCDRGPAHVREFFDDREHAFVVTTTEQYDKLKPVLPTGVVVLERLPKFPERGEVLLLGRTPRRVPHVSERSARVSRGL